MVAPLSRTLCHQLFGWKRSSCTRQPPAASTTIVENAIAFTWFSGSGVITRSRRGRTVQTPSSPAYHSPARRKYALLEHAALGPAGGARGVEQRAFGVVADGARASGAAPRRRGRHGGSSAPIVRTGHAGRAAAAAQIVCALRQRHRQADLAVADQVFSSAERISALIGTTLTPSALSANQWNRNAGRFSSSSPTRWPWP